MRSALVPIWSFEAISALPKMGIDVWIVKGDNSRTAATRAKQVSTSNVFAEVMPAEIASKVKKLQKEGTPVAMVGDGGNDSYAIAQANVVSLSALELKLQLKPLTSY